MNKFEQVFYFIFLFFQTITSCKISQLNGQNKNLQVFTTTSITIYQYNHDGHSANRFRLLTSRAVLVPRF